MRRDRQLPEVQDVSTNLESRSPRVDLLIDRDKAAASADASTIANALGDRPRPPLGDHDLRPALAVYRVLLELDPKYQQADSLQKILSRRRGT
jgi:multidrug efflux pump subunit AcrB